MAKRKEKRDKIASHCRVRDLQPANRRSTAHHRLEIVGCSSADPTAYPGHKSSGRCDHLGANVVSSTSHLTPSFLKRASKGLLSSPVLHTLTKREEDPLDK